MILPTAQVGKVLRQTDNQRARCRRLANQLATALEVRVDVLARGHLHRGDDQVGHGTVSLTWPEPSSGAARSSAKTAVKSWI